MKRLTQIQAALKAPKDNKADKFKFRSAEDILERVKPLLEKTDTAVTLSDDVMLIGERMFLKATAVLRSPDGEIAQASAYAEFDAHIVVDKYTKEAKKSMSNEQATGCASSYARKYALCGLFAIDNSENDPDNDEIQPAPKQPAQPKQQAQQEAKPLTQREQDELDAAMAQMDFAISKDELNQIYARYKDAEFAAKLLEHGMAICKQNGWEAKSNGKEK